MKDESRGTRNQKPETNAMPKLFNIDIDAVTKDEAVATVRDWVQGGAPLDRKAPCRYVVTPNVDHAVMYGHRQDLRNAYSNASLVLADGAPLVWASRLFGCKLPERVAGSDLVPAQSQGRIPDTRFAIQ